VREDVTDGVAIRRRTAMWRWVLSVVVAAALLVALVVLVVRLDVDRSPGTLAAVVTAAVLAATAVAVTWWESRRITRHLNRTVERLIDTEAELRLLLDDLPEAVISLDDAGVVRGANARPPSSPDGRSPTCRGDRSPTWSSPAAVTRRRRGSMPAAAGGPSRP
jgi:PAS domain-containing protein